MTTSSLPESRSAFSVKSPMSFATVEVMPPKAIIIVDNDAEEGEASFLSLASGYDSATQATAMRPPTVHINPISTVFAISFNAPKPMKTSSEVKYPPIAYNGKNTIASVAARAPGRETTPLALLNDVRMMFTEPAKIGNNASVINIAPRFSNNVPASPEESMNGGSVKNNKRRLALVIESDQIGRLAARGTTWYATAKIRAISVQDWDIRSPSHTVCVESASSPKKRNCEPKMNDARAMKRNQLLAETTSPFR